MTTFATSQLPSGIITVEQVHLWSTLVLTSVNGTKAIIEATNSYPEEMSQWNMFRSPNDGLRTLCRVNLQIDPLVASDKTKKMWLFANELTTGTIPTTFTVA
jgi:hypothetical protein